MSDEETTKLLPGSIVLHTHDDKEFVWTNRLRIILCIMAVANMSNFVCYSCIAPFFPLEASLKRLSLTQTGIVFSSYELVAFFMCPTWGRILPRLGIKLTFVMGLTGAGVNVIMFGLLKRVPDQAPFFWLALASRLVTAFFASAFATSAYAYSAHLFRGILECCGGIGLSLGPTLGAILYDAGGFVMPFFVLGTFVLTVAAAAILILPEFKPVIRTREESAAYKTPTVWKLMKIPTTVVQYLGVMSTTVCYSFVEPTMQKHLAPFGLSMLQVGFFFFVIAGSYTATNPIWGVCADRWPQYTMFMQIAAALGTAVGVSFIGPSPLLRLPQTLPIIGIGLALLGMAPGGMLIPSIDKCIVSAVRSGYASDVELYGLVSGLYQSAFSIGGGFGPMVGVVLIENFGYEWGITCIGAFMVFVAIVFSVNMFYSRADERCNYEELVGILNK